MNKIQLNAVGADPELFFQDKGGEPVSVEPLIDGRKDFPEPMQGLPDGFAVQADNVAAEYNIPPTHSAQQFSLAIAQGLSYVKKIAQGNGLKLAIVPELDFPDFQLMTPHAQELGCDPDFNIWEMKQNPRPKPPRNMRTAAGHVHVSWDQPDEEQRIWVGRALDLFLGVPSILVTNKSRRRDLYGKAGAVRLKEYGLEYRTLDNFWISSTRLSKVVFYNVQAALGFVNAGPMAQRVIMDYAEEIINSINNHDRETAEKLIATFNIPTF